MHIFQRENRNLFCVAFLFSFLLIGLFFLYEPGDSHAGNIRLASTTSTENTGLFDYLLPLFEKKTGIKVQVVAVGTVAAIELGKRGDADAVLVHAKELELEAVKEGYFTDRHDVMYNDFVIVGPPSDPAGVASSASPLAKFAFKRIAFSGQVSPSGQFFVSRGDNSGTHIKEKELWKAAGIDPANVSGFTYLEVGQGMAETLRIAGEKQAYTLSDRGTFYALQDELPLKILFKGDPFGLLSNQYGVMAVNPNRFSHVNYRDALIFINWLISEEGQDAIAAFKDKGNQLFFPNANKIGPNADKKGAKAK